MSMNAMATLSVNMDVKIPKALTDATAQRDIPGITSTTNVLVCKHQIGECVITIAAARHFIIQYSLDCFDPLFSMAVLTGSITVPG